MLRQRTEQACVWMRAGVIRYRLCDRGFDCDRCPLDAGLRARGIQQPRTGAPGSGSDAGAPDSDPAVSPVDAPSGPRTRER